MEFMDPIAALQLVLLNPHLRGLMKFSAAELTAEEKANGHFLNSSIARNIEVPSHPSGERVHLVPLAWWADETVVCDGGKHAPTAEIYSNTVVAIPDTALYPLVQMLFNFSRPLLTSDIAAICIAFLPSISKRELPLELGKRSPLVRCELFHRSIRILSESLVRNVNSDGVLSFTSLWALLF